MSKLVHILVQVALAIVQVSGLATSFVPPKYQPMVTAVVGVAQAGLAIYNHGGSNVQSGK
jgi:hypothetical protein